ncbi:M43 family zinc metalloprotease [Aquimarina sp. 2201CG5-10]|uniref:M43 family zinc metalloprotease n=1 Tax=Aquimarina callyspongiae TaxID=3098150 RepID=UPI002AB37D3E|nr:M43 family zinc metalloprotease [Aquimarina sp. 2201CG5-10]MDY8134849.1 M43 family zinc metalloprotease [Aquimarina sp. 2201CG5-10]
MKTKTLFLVVLSFWYASFLSAQEGEIDAIRCKTNDANHYAFSKNPKAKAEFEKFNEFTKNYVHSETFSQKAGETYVIPVVFHVYGEVQHGKTVTYEKIKTAIDVLNKDFNGLNDDWNTIDPVFNGRKATLSIRFALAKIDPNGVTTNGVVFHPVASGMGNYNSPIVARDGWDNYKYMNVYITGDLYGDGVSNNSGVAWYPNTTMSNQDIARVVYNGQYLHGNTDKEFASVLTHEFGHWLNLIHTFEGGCNDPNGDYVSDTPKEDTNSGDDGCRVGASDCGNLINYENYMGYDSTRGCAKMYTRGQIDRMLAALEHSTRRPLWQPSNLAATGVADDGASFVVSNATVEEAISNDGTVSSDTNEIEISGGSFALSSGTMTEGTHFTSNLPQGYSASITVLNNRTLRVQFSGRTNNHAVSNNTTGTITFRNAAISGGTATLATDKVTYQFSFLDPYKIVYVNNNDLTVNSSNTWEPLTDDFLPSLGTVLGNFSGLFYNASGHPSSRPAIQFETYEEAMITVGNTRNIAIVPANTVIDAGSSWVNGGSYPNLLDIRTDSYRTWDGQTGYAGFRFSINGRQHYGWYRLRVSSNGSSATLLDYAYNTKPFEGINAGSQGGDPTCDDGIQNGDETGIDCGGSSCPACPVEVDGGSVSSSDDRTDITTITGDGQADVITFKNTSQSSASYRYLITDDSGTILATENTSHDFEGATPGVCRVYGISYEGILSVTGKNISDSGLASGVFDISSNWITITRIDDNTGPTCDDGIQNGDETGIDCGGSCEPCSTVTYCSASTTQNTLHITNVKFGDIDNSTAHTPYSNHTNLSTSLTAGGQTALTVKLNNDHWTYNAVGVWIDWNNNGDFTDSGEKVYSRFAAGPYTANITPPAGAVANVNLRMRVRAGYGAESKITPCGVDTYIGEVEDYTVRIGGVATPTCTDGIQNGDETGIDCGGSCAPCNTNEGVIYVDIADETVTSSNTWEFFRIEAGDNRDYGAWYTGGSVRLVTYDKDIVCNGNTNNATFIGENVAIDGSSNFVPESHSYIVSSSSYNDWNGKTGYIGFTFKINGNTHYGWFHITVASNGLSYTILDYAYQTNANTVIYTGNNNRNSSLTKELDKDESVITIYPNPVIKTMYVNGARPDTELRLYTLQGRLVAKKKGDTMDVDGLPSGIYILSLEGKQTFQIVKE